MIPDDVTFLSNVAAAGAVLLGLSFVSLSFFLVDLLKRYDAVPLPVVAHRNANDSKVFTRILSGPESLTDFELFDGDALVVFIAFSVAVSWNLFLLPITIGMTAAIAPKTLFPVAAEMVAFLGTLTFSSLVRNRKLKQLGPYKTREEALWSPLAMIALCLHTAACLVVIMATLSYHKIPLLDDLRVWSRLGLTDLQAAVIVLKITCLVALLLGTYTVNKDMFVFFKCIARERMRARWLKEFLKETYPVLKRQVGRALSDVSWDSHEKLSKQWGNGYPTDIAALEALKVVRADCLPEVWQRLAQRKDIALGWMIDVGGVAQWADGIEACLQDHRSYLRVKRKGSPVKRTPEPAKKREGSSRK